MPLREACFNGNVPIIKYLLQHGADPNGCAPDNGELILESFIWSYSRPSRTSMRHWLRKKLKKTFSHDISANRAVLRRLLRAGADPNLRSKHSLRPILQDAIFQNVK